MSEFVLGDKFKLNTTKELIPGSAIFIVDVEAGYCDPKNYEFLPPPMQEAITQKLEERIQKIANHLKEVKEDYPLFSTADGPLHTALEEGLNLTELPYWASLDEDVLPEEIINALSQYETVLVCGLFRERCVFHVTRMLKNAGINAVLLNTRKFTIESRVVFGTDNLADNARMFQLVLNPL